MISIFKEMWAPPTAKAALELTRLYRTLEELVDRRPGSAVAITCAHDNDQVKRLVYNLAWVGSTLLGKRVLVLDTTASNVQASSHSWNPPSRRNSDAAQPARSSQTVTAAEPAVSGRAPQQALVDMDRVLRESNDVGLLSLRVTQSATAAVTPQLTEIWGKLQSTFDLILVATPPVLEDPTASCLGSVVDGAVLVVGSGQSRQRDVKRAIELLTSGATPLLGVVMTDMRRIFPGWLRRLFGRD